MRWDREWDQTEEHLHMSDLLGLSEERPSGETSGTVESGPDPAAMALAHSGANWFYWIAGLSVVNIVALIANLNFHFLAGLGLSEVVGAVATIFVQEGVSPLLLAFPLILDILLVAGLALVGYYSRRFVLPVFLIGIIVYILDGLLVLALGDMFMAGFHVFALIYLIRGYLAARQVVEQRRLEQATSPA